MAFIGNLALLLYLLDVKIKPVLRIVVPVLILLSVIAVYFIKQASKASYVLYSPQAEIRTVFSEDMEKNIETRPERRVNNLQIMETK